jgi:hypothetical protein
VVVAAGATSYLRVGVVSTPVWVEVALTPMGPVDAQRDLASLSEVQTPARGD